MSEVFVDASAGPAQQENAMLRKIVTWIIIIPAAAIMIAFAVANRQMVTVSFDPFSATSPAYAVTLPLFVVLLVVLILGVLVGGFAAWLGQSKWRRSARRLKADLRALQQDIDIRDARDIYRNQPQPSAGQASLSIAPPTIP